MENRRLTGAFTAIVTPFKQDGSIVAPYCKRWSNVKSKLASTALFLVERRAKPRP